MLDGMGQPLTERLAALLEAGEAEPYAEHHFVSVLTLDSGMRYGLIEDGSWALVEGDELTVFAPGTEMLFVEVLEVPRDEFDDRVLEAGRGIGCDPEELLFSFPVVELVSATLASASPHFRRISLMWLLPTELRGLRQAILAVAQDRSMPGSLRELAQRMVVGGD
jgi:hypothetical protein